MKIALSNKVLLAMTLAGGVALAQTPDWNALGKTWWSHVQFLADDSLEGRDTGSRGFEKAAAYRSSNFAPRDWSLPGSRVIASLWTFRW